MNTQQVLRRKQFLISESNIKKLNKIAKQEKVSATEIVRRSINAYDPMAEAGNIEELLAVALDTTEDAIHAVREAANETISVVNHLKAKRDALNVH